MQFVIIASKVVSGECLEGVWNFLGSKLFRPKISWTQNVFVPKIVLDLKFFGPKIFFDQNFLDLKFFKMADGIWKGTHP